MIYLKKLNDYPNEYAGTAGDNRRFFGIFSFKEFCGLPITKFTKKYESDNKMDLDSYWYKNQKYTNLSIKNRF